jgi:hypothetical protein
MSPFKTWQWVRVKAGNLGAGDTFQVKVCWQVDGSWFVQAWITGVIYAASKLENISK